MKESQIPRWLVENDPTWEKSIDSNIGVLRWTKKGSGGMLTAVCSPTSMMCSILGSDEAQGAGLVDPLSAVDRNAASSRTSMGLDITKYLSSRYLNPQFGQPSGGFDLKRKRGFQ